MEAHNSFNPASKAFYRVIFEIFPMKNRDRSIEPKKLVTYGKFMYGDNLVTRRADRSKGFGRLLFDLNGFWRGGSLRRIDVAFACPAGAATQYRSIRVSRVSLPK